MTATSRRIAATAAALLLLGSGCESRNLGTAHTEFGCWDLWECNPDRDCGLMVECLGGFCRPDLPRALVACPYDQCITDDDCVVAEPYDCCNGCPQVTDASALSQMECFYERGTEPGTPPPGCLIDCTACPICFPQPLGARCELGLCVATEEGCPADATAVPPLITTAALLTNPQSYDGGTFRIQGTALPGGGVCAADCPSHHCCEHGVVLDGMVALRGAPCNMQLAFWGDDVCADPVDSEGLLPGGEYVAQGTLHLGQDAEAPWTMDVDALYVAEPEGVGGGYEVWVTAVIADADDPSCPPPTLQEGDWGWVWLAENGGLLEVVAPLFDCFWEFWGTADPEGWIEARAPITCDGTCDYLINGQVTGSMVYAAYTTFDGLCYYEYQFSGSRAPQEHALPAL